MILLKILYIEVLVGVILFVGLFVVMGFFYIIKEMKDYKKNDKITVEDAKKIRKIGLKNIDDKNKLRQFANEKGYSNEEVIRVVHAKTADDILSVIG